MRFDISQEFDAALDEVFEHYTSPAFFEDLPEFGRIGRPELLEHRVADGRVLVRARYAFTAELPAAALAVIDPERLTWVEETTYDIERRSAAVAFRPDHYASKLQASATVRFAGDRASATRTVAGDLRVRVLLVGGQVERAIVGGLREHLDEEADHVDAVLGS